LQIKEGEADRETNKRHIVHGFPEKSSMIGEKNLEGGGDGEMITQERKLSKKRKSRSLVGWGGDCTLKKGRCP